MMIHQPTLLPSNWIELVNNFDTSKIESMEGQIIAEKIKGLILEKQESIIGARLIQVFLSAVINKKYNIYEDFHSIPKYIIDEAFSEIKGEVGLRFCEKLESILIELISFRDVLQINGFTLIEKERAEGQSDFFLKKHCLEYEAEVKFKMSDQSFHDSITHLIMGYSMLLSANCLIGKEVSINIKLQAVHINDSNKKRVYQKVENWCKTILCDFSDEDLDITIGNGTDKIVGIKCGDSARLGVVPESNVVSNILKNHMFKIKTQFENRNPKRSIGIIVWATPWNYDSEEKEQIEANIINGIQSEIDSIGYICDRLYIYPTKLKKSLLFKSKKDN